MKAHTDHAWTARALLLALLLLAGCNEAPDSEIVSEEISVSSLAGNYAWVGFTIRRPGELPFTARDVGEGEFEGSLLLTREGGLVERRTLDNVSTIIFSTYRVLSPAFLEIVVPLMDCVVRLPVSLEDGILTTFLSEREARRCGDGTEEHIIWHRTD